MDSERPQTRVSGPGFIAAFHEGLGPKALSHVANLFSLLADEAKKMAREQIKEERARLSSIPWDDFITEACGLTVWQPEPQVESTGGVE